MSDIHKLRMRKQLQALRRAAAAARNPEFQEMWRMHIRILDLQYRRQFCRELDWK